MIDEERAKEIIEACKKFVEALKEAFCQLWNSFKTFINKLYERWIIAIQNESAKRTIFIYRRTKNKRIKKKKLKQLILFSIEELMI